MTWTGLSQLLQNLFGVNDGFNLEYQDPENDMIVLGSSEEWEECLRIGQSYASVEKPLRLYLRKSKAARSERCHRGLNSSAQSIFEASHFYNSGESPEPTFLQNVQNAVPKLIENLLPTNWHTFPKKETLPDWLQPAVNVNYDQGEYEVDVNIGAFGTVLSKKALELMDRREYEKALELLNDAVKVQPTPEKYYNMACCLALMGRRDEAFEALDQSVKLGYSNIEHLYNDTDLDSLKKDGRFEDLVARITSSLPNEVPSAPEVVPEPVVTEVINVEPKQEVEPESPKTIPKDVEVVVENPEKFYFREQLDRLHEMGFFEDSISIELLRKHNGRVAEVIENLF